jgi:hypothetical protein
MSAADTMLYGLKRDAQWLRYYAGETERHVIGIQPLPAFRTQAEAELDDAERALQSALDRVRDVRANIRPAPKLQATG